MLRYFPAGRGEALMRKHPISPYVQETGAGSYPAPVAVQVETEVNSPDWDAELAVVAWLNLPVTVALVPDAVLLKLKLADPLPPAT